MLNLNLKQKIMVGVAIIGALLILLFQRGIYGKTTVESAIEKEPSNQTVVQQTDKPVVISTVPSPLEEAIIVPTQVIEITLNLPLENVGEFKNRIEPKSDYTVKLSDDRKTAKIIPTPLFNLGTTFTLFILTDSKFDGGKRLDHELIYHFKTLEYKGV